MAFFKCNGLWCRRWAALQNPAEASETSFHLPASYAGDVGRKRASLLLCCFFFLLVHRAVQFTYTHTSSFLSLIMFFFSCTGNNYFPQLVSNDWFSLPVQAKVTLLTLCATLTCSLWAWTQKSNIFFGNFFLFSRNHSICVALLYHPQLQTALLWNVLFTAWVCNVSSEGLFTFFCPRAVVRITLCSSFLSDYTLAWIE